MNKGRVYQSRSSLRHQLADIWKQDRLMVGVVIVGLALMFAAGVGGAALAYYQVRDITTGFMIDR